MGSWLLILGAVRREIAEQRKNQLELQSSQEKIAGDP